MKIKSPPARTGPKAVDRQDPRRLCLAAWGRRVQGRAVGGGVSLSTDGGDTWRAVLAKGRHVYDAIVDRRENRRRIRGFNFKWGYRVIPDPIDRAKIYITTYGGGVWHGPAEGDEGASEDLGPPTETGREHSSH